MALMIFDTTRTGSRTEMRASFAAEPNERNSLVRHSDGVSRAPSPTARDDGPDRASGANRPCLSYSVVGEEHASVEVGAKCALEADAAVAESRDYILGEGSPCFPTQSSAKIDDLRSARARPRSLKNEHAALWKSARDGRCPSPRHSARYRIRSEPARRQPNDPDDTT